MVDAVEALGQTRDMARLDPQAAVGDAEHRLRAAPPPAEPDIPACRRVVHGIAHQVAECAAQFLRVGEQQDPVFRIELDAMAPGTQGQGFIAHAGKQDGNIDQGLLVQAPAALQRR